MNAATVLKTKVSPPNVFEYDDYRLFLRESYDFLKEHSRQFSFRYFSRRAGFASPNFLKLVMDGQRNLSAESIPKFIEALKLSKAEGEFFSHLVHFGQSKTATERAGHAELILRSKDFRKIYPLKLAEFSYYACWYYIPVRELVALAGFREDAFWIAHSILPNITPAEAETALRDLELIGLLKRDENGRLVQSTRTVTTPNEVTSCSVSSYHKDMMRIAGDSIEAVPRERREISAACIPVSEKTAFEIKRRIQEFRTEILLLAGQDESPDRIYQLNLQLFPLSQAHVADVEVTL